MTLDPEIEQKAMIIRQAQKGLDVREGLASGMEFMDDKVNTYQAEMSGAWDDVVQAESARVIAEQGRVTAENTIQSNEQTRQTNETNRVNEFNTIKTAYDSSTHENTSVELTAARISGVTGQAYNNIGLRMDNVDSQLAENANNIISFGGIGDGSTANDTAFNNAKTKGKVYFPQNSTNNAVYYFTNAPTLDNIKIYADDNVILSVPTTNYVSFKNANIKNNIKIYSRDRDNYGKQIPNIVDELTLFSGISDKGYRLKNGENIGDIVCKEFVLNSSTVDMNFSNVINAGTVDKYTFSYKTSGISTYGDNIIYAIGKADGILVGDSYITSLRTYAWESLNLDKAKTRACAIVTCGGNPSDYYMFSVDLNGNYYIVQNNNGVLGTETLIQSKIAEGYYIHANQAAIVINVRVANKNTVEFYVNGVRIYTLNTGVKVPSGVYFGYTAQNSNWLDNTFINNIEKFYAKKSYFSKKLKIAVFGDSISFGEGSSVGWAELLPKLLIGKRGIYDVSISNFSHSGDNSAAQLTVMQNTDLSQFDIVLILIGTNDILGGVGYATLGSNLEAMVDLAQANSRKAIVGIPPMWVNHSETNTGFNIQSAGQGGTYRNTIYFTANNKGCYVADVMAEFGQIDINNTQLRDNLHPQAWADILIAKCYANTLLDVLNNDIEAENNTENIIASLSNGWVIVNSNIPVRLLKDIAGNTQINCLIKSGTTAGNILRVPSGFRPKYNINIPIIVADGTSILSNVVVLQPDGYLVCASSLPLGKDWYNVSFTYKAEQ